RRPNAGVAEVDDVGIELRSTRSADGRALSTVPGSVAAPATAPGTSCPGDRPAGLRCSRWPTVIATERATTMKALQYRTIGAGPEVVEIETPEPGPGQVRLKVSAAGVCHSDEFVMSLPQ